jgi:hypothetical protein
MAVKQRIYTSTGGWYDIATTAGMVYAPSSPTYGHDGHNHWHLRDLETGTLSRLDNGVKVGSLQKHGFCFYDNTRFRLWLARAPQDPVYTWCGSQSSLSVRMGISVGWGDTYRYTTHNQWIDVTNVPNGRYRLRATAETARFGFREKYTWNNHTHVDVAISGTTVKVLAWGPAA